MSKENMYDPDEEPLRPCKANEVEGWGDPKGGFKNIKEFILTVASVLIGVGIGVLLTHAFLVVDCDKSFSQLNKNNNIERVLQDGEVVAEGGSQRVSFKTVFDTILRFGKPQDPYIYYELDRHDATGVFVVLEVLECRKTLHGFDDGPCFHEGANYEKGESIFD